MFYNRANGEGIMRIDNDLSFPKLYDEEIFKQFFAVVEPIIKDPKPGDSYEKRSTALVFFTCLKVIETKAKKLKGTN